jgi:glucokinase
VKKERNQVGRPSLLRHTNALTVLQLLREAGTCSRADLVRASGLSAPTVTKVVADLLDANLIKPLGEGESSGGRPPNMISFKAERGCLLAVQITASSLILLLTDLSGDKLDHAEVSLAGKSTTPEAICHLIGDELHRLLTKHKKARKQLLVMVVAVPAIANVNDGIVVSITTLEGWRSVPLRTLLSNLVDCLVIIENDTNLAAAGERFGGSAQIEDNFILVNIGANVSAGIILNGEIHHGAQWSAGEIGYLRLPSVSGKHPALYDFGDLEYILTSSGIDKSWREEAGSKTIPKTISDNDGAGSTESSALAVLDLALAGNSRAKNIIEHRAVILSDIIINLSLILNPALILLGGSIGSHPALFNSVQKQLEQCEFAVTKVAVASLADTAALWGAIAIALDAIPLVLLPLPPS